MKEATLLANPGAQPKIFPGNKEGIVKHIEKYDETRFIIVHIVVKIKELRSMEPYSSWCTIGYLI